jgi:hypothetical protein
MVLSDIQYKQSRYIMVTGITCGNSGNMNKIL